MSEIRIARLRGARRAPGLGEGTAAPSENRQAPFCTALATRRV